MKFSYRLKRVCGSVYTNGNVYFLPDGNSLVSPVGNRLNLFDLLNQTSESLPFECPHNIQHVTISNNGKFIIIVDIEGHALFYNLSKKILLNRFNFRQKIADIKFSPDDQFFAITYGNGVQIWRTPSTKKEFSPLVLFRTLQGFTDQATCLNWSHDSKSMIIGSRDNSVRIYYQVLSKKMALNVLQGHRNKILGVYFTQDDREVYTISNDGGIFQWSFEENEELKKLKKLKQEVDERKRSRGEAGLSEEENEDEEEENEDDEVASVNDSDSEIDFESDHIISEKNQEKLLKLYKDELKERAGHWRLVNRHLINEKNDRISCTNFNSSSNILVLGFESGIFSLYEMPDLVNIHRLSVSNCSVSTVALNQTGEWMALGSAELGQLLVWEWKSETYILKQQGHLYGLKSLDFSAEGQYIATGGEDGKVKLWNTLTGFCVITFKDHLAPVSGVKFIKQGTGKALLTSSLDGTIRAYDLLRYKNFKTLTAPLNASGASVQFTCLATDSQGEIVCAGSLDPFNIYVFALQTGKLIEILSGHEGPISCLEFSPLTGTLASGSWDGTLKIWDVYKSTCVETFEHGCDVLAVSFRPDGKEVCCSCTNGNIYVWDVENGEQINLIEGRRDIAGGRLTTDARTVENSAQNKFFNSLSYSADGLCILAGGKSKYICIYSVETSSLIKKFQLSHNLSLEGILDKLRSDRLVDGIQIDNLPNSTNPDEDHTDPNYRRKLIGKKETSSGIISSLSDGNRTVRPEILTSSLKFSPTGREWAAATTQGLQIFSLDEGILFAPIELDVAITSQTVALYLSNEDYPRALTVALHLGEKEIIKKTIESIGINSINLVLKTLDKKLLKLLIEIISEELLNSRYLEYYLQWIVSILTIFGQYLNNNNENLLIIESLRSVLRGLNQHEKEIMKISSDNLYSLTFLLTQMSVNDDFLGKVEEKEKENEENDEKKENEIDNNEVEVIDAPWNGNWNSTWNDEDDEKFSSTTAATTSGTSSSINSLLDLSASHFMGEGSMNFSLNEEEDNNNEEDKEKKKNKKNKNKKSKN